MTETYIEGYLDTELGAVEYHMIDRSNVLLRGAITFNEKEYYISSLLKCEVDWNVEYVRVPDCCCGCSIDEKIAPVILKAWIAFVTDDMRRAVDRRNAEDELRRAKKEFEIAEQNLKRIREVYQQAEQRLKELS